MKTLEDLGDTAQEIAQQSQQKQIGQDAITHLREMISAEEAKIRNLYYKIGEIYVSTNLHDILSKLDRMISEIEEASKNIQLFEQKIQQLPNDSVCPTCGEIVQADDIFCWRCGTRLSKGETTDETPSKSIVRSCTCGALLEEGNNFCTECGRPVEASFGVETEIKRRICKTCGAIVAEDDKYCIECGTEYTE